MNTEVIVAIVSLGIAIIADVIATVKNTGSIKDRISDTKESVKTESASIQKNDELLHTKTVANSDKNKTALSQEHSNIISSIEKEHNKLDSISRIVEAEAQARRVSEQKQDLRFAKMDLSEQKFSEALTYMSDLKAMYEREVDRNIALTNDIEKIQQEIENLKIEYETTVHMCNDLNEENARLRQIVSNMKQQIDKKPRHDIEPLQP